MVTTGCTEGIAAALLGLVNPGDEVVVLEPYYDSYTAMIQMAGGVRRPVTLRAPDFRLDVDELRAAVTPRTRFVLLNSPHNPTGTVLTRAELQAVADVAIEHDLVVITDEVYEHLVFDDREHVPLATLPGMCERTLTLSSAGKSYSFTGWKVGWATGPAELVGAVLAAKQWLTFTSGAPLQPAVALALDEEPDFPTDARGGPAGAPRPAGAPGWPTAGLDVRVPQGTYFATTDISHLGWARRPGVLPALPERAGVVAMPMEVFYDDPDAGAGGTWCAGRSARRPSVIEEALRRLAAADLEAVPDGGWRRAASGRSSGLSTPEPRRRRRAAAARRSGAREEREQQHEGADGGADEAAAAGDAGGDDQHDPGPVDAGGRPARRAPAGGDAPQRRGRRSSGTVATSSRSSEIP